MIHVAFEIATNSQEILWDGSFELCFKCNWDLMPALFLWGRLRGQSVLAVGRHWLVHTSEDDASIQLHVRGWYRIRKIERNLSKKN